MPILKDRGWFSCLDDVDGRVYLTLWQAIVYILRHVDGLPDDEYWPYIEALHKLEEDSANDLLDQTNNHKTDPHWQLDSADSGGVKHYRFSDEPDCNAPHLEDRLANSSELADHLDLLEFNRKNLTEQFAIPYVVYTILTADIARAELSLPIKLVLKKKNDSDSGRPLIRRTSIKNWQKANALTALGLQQAGKVIKPKQTTPDRIDRLYLTIGIIGRLLTQPDDGFRKDFLRKDISTNALVEHMIDRAATDRIECPRNSTLTDYLNTGEQACVDGTVEKPFP